MSNKLSLILVGGILFMSSLFFLSPALEVAADTEDTAPFQFDDEEVKSILAFMQNESEPFGRLPKATDKPLFMLRVPVTAYSSEVGQTDSTPFITAWNTHVRDGVVAANFLPFGTRIRLPDLFGDKEFVVEDRMNRRYQYRVDIWMSETPAAKKFGIKHTRIEVL